MIKRDYSKKVARAIYRYLKPRTSGKFYDKSAGFFRFSKRVSDSISINCSLIVAKYGFVVFAFYPFELQDLTDTGSREPEWVSRIKNMFVFKKQYNNCHFEIEYDGKDADVWYKHTCLCGNGNPSPFEIRDSIEDSLWKMCEEMPEINYAYMGDCILPHDAKFERRFFLREDEFSTSDGPEYEGILDKNDIPQEGWKYLCRYIDENIESFNYRPRLTQLPNLILKRRRR